MSSVNYIWDVLTDDVLMETDSTDTTLAVYTNEPSQYGRLVSQRRNGQTNYYHYDGNGNTIVLTDDAESVIDTYIYEAFGTTVASTGTTINAFRYGGQYGYQYDSVMHDYYVRQRVYYPQQGRWMSTDLARFLDTTNLYTYTRNNAASLTDPTGTVCVATARTTRVAPKLWRIYKDLSGTFRDFTFDVEAKIVADDCGPCPSNEGSYTVSLTVFGRHGKRGFPGEKLIMFMRRGYIHAVVKPLTIANVCGIDAKKNNPTVSVTQPDGKGSRYFKANIALRCSVACIRQRFEAEKTGRCETCIQQPVARGGITVEGAHYNDFGMDVMLVNASTDEGVLRAVRYGIKHKKSALRIRWTIEWGRPPAVAAKPGCWPPLVDCGSCEGVTIKLGTGKIQLPGWQLLDTDKSGWK